MIISLSERQTSTAQRQGTESPCVRLSGARGWNTFNLSTISAYSVKPVGIFSETNVSRETYITFTIKGGVKVDVNAVITIIQNVGFPICVAIALFWKLDKDDERHRDAEEKMTEAINNNTNVITKLSERLGGEKNVD